MDDTKYFEQAVNEYCLKRSMSIKIGDLSMGELSYLLRRAQELKELHQKSNLNQSRPVYVMKSNGSI